MKIKTFVLGIFLAVAMIGNTHALTFRVEASRVAPPDTIVQCVPFSIDIYMNNNDAVRYGHQMTFSFYSPDASITTATHYDVGATGPFGSIEIPVFEDEASTTHMSWDNNLPDTISKMGVYYDICTGWPNDLGEQLHYRFHFVIDDPGRFCIDSIGHEIPAYDWVFEPPLPAFNGPYCWTVADEYIPGDITHDGDVNYLDILKLIRILFPGKEMPLFPGSADVNGDCHIDALDIFYLKDNIYGSGPDPVESPCCLPLLNIHENLPAGICLQKYGDWRPTQGSPIGGGWMEVWPETGESRTVTNWWDEGDGQFSMNDTVRFNDIDTLKYRVTYVGPSLKLTPDGETDPLYFFLADFGKGSVDDMTEVIGTHWHSPLAPYTYYYICYEWTDDGDTILDDGDRIGLFRINDDTDKIDGTVDLFRTGAILYRDCCTDYGLTPGDAYADGIINLLDILKVIEYLYEDPEHYPPHEFGCDALYDANGDGDSAYEPIINLLDILLLIEHVYTDPFGSPPLYCPPNGQTK